MSKELTGSDLLAILNGRDVALQHPVYAGAEETDKVVKVTKNSAGVLSFYHAGEEISAYEEVIWPPPSALVDDLMMLAGKNGLLKTACMEQKIQAVLDKHNLAGDEYEDTHRWAAPPNLD